MSALHRNVLVLTLAQALYSSAIIVFFATGGLVGLTIAPDRGWATMPVTALVAGSMVSTVPCSYFMQRFGRRAGFILGALAALAGALLAVWSIVHAQFLVFCAASFLLGIYQASSGYLRFAAIDISPDAFKPRAISWVLTGGVAAAIFGTLLVQGTIDLFAPYAFAGCYAALAAIVAAAIVVLLFLDIPNPRADTAKGETRPLGALLSEPRLAIAVASATLAYGMMNLVMTSTPIAMVDCGFLTTDAAWVIQWHVLGMFVPSYVTGSLISRYGAERIASAGMLLLILAAAVALMGISFGHFAVALIVLGIGWNFGFIGGTTMLAGTYRPAERAKVQAFNDFCISALMAVASLSSGQLLGHLGWSAVNVAVIPVATVALGLILWLALRRAPRPA